ncbi:MAG TPA: ABC transporter permease [Spirochaetota bacterium]|nr:ABC transporter permease [Spirochaetota bacterium]HPS86586.1 ABC transporter permease [Spirochaetota bacterium]
MFTDTGERITHQLKFTGFTLILIFKTFLTLRFVFAKRGEIVKQMYISGVKSMPVCTIVALFGGMILALHTGVELAKFGQQELVPTLMINIMNKEMGSFLTSIIITAFSGAAMAAELGTMKVSEEIDALEMMSINPVAYLVMPRVVSMMIMLPTLSIYTIILGVAGGGIISYFQLGITTEAYYHKVFQSIWLKDMYVGLLKSFVFGLMISSISCANGLKAEGGALGVGQATRVSVVSSYLLVLIMGYFITALFYGGFL